MNLNNNIDPFLYRSHQTELEKRFQNEPAKTNKAVDSKDFHAELYRGISRANKPQISSDIFTKNLSKAQVKNHVGNDPARKKLYEAAEQFEAFFLEKMYKSMKKNLGKDLLIHGGFAEEVFDDMLLQERVGQMAHQGEFGLAEKIYQQMQRLI